MPKDKPTVLVIGGGYGGMRSAANLSAEFDVTVVDPKQFWESTHSPAMIADPGLANKYLIPYPKAINHKQDAVVSISSDGTKGEAKLRGGEVLKFDYAVLALGSLYPPFKPGSAAYTKESRAAFFQATHDEVDKASSVVVVGGGNVGVELAAALATAFPGKKLTLVAGPADRLLPRMDPKASEYALAFLQTRGVEVLLGEGVADWGGLAADAGAGATTLTTDKGRTIEGVAFRAAGPKPATAALAESFQPGQLTPTGAVVVEPTLQVKGWPNVFAVGDCAGLEVEASAGLANFEATAAAQNLIALAKGSEELQSFPQGFFGIPSLPYLGGAALGRKEGVYQLGSDVQTGSGPAWVRALLDLLIGWFVRRAWLRSGMYATLTGAFRGAIVKEAKKSAGDKKED